MESAPRIKEQINPEKIRLVKGAIFGAFLSVFPTEQVRAESISIDAGWQSGAQMKHHAMENEKDELAGLFVIAPGEKGQWSNLTKGNHDSVAFSYDNNVNAVDTYTMESESGSTFRVCAVHTHPDDNHERYQYGPSVADLEIDARFAEYVQEKVAEEYQVKVEVNGMIFERHGVWYYTVSDPNQVDITVASAGGESPANLLEAFERELDTNDDKKSTKMSREIAYLMAQLALLEKGVQARFVDYETFYTEPPCAGVSYGQN
jgi:proteasome lid subunit RPN8/RPN11